MNVVYNVVILLAICVSSSKCSGGQFLIETLTAEENGYPVHYCEWKGSRFLPGTNFKDYDKCVQCKCSNKYLSCNSLLETIILKPEDDELSECKPVKTGCEVKWVLKTSVTIQCPVHKIPKHQAVI
ncbi:uncharacterized protein LOC132715948 [Ruditapes philippinarum]|uniref:uncharacterized protein LOC132715948 n=1 Tax=Ruditapes philippinarum TaxID=129788 RepID=UPI00295AA957|nr:uncharacterized protein LOC132715948 [Ruditapes philippinarum]